MKKNKVNFKQPKYIIPLVVLPFVLFIGAQIVNLFIDDSIAKEEEKKDLSTSLGSVETNILNKNKAYDQLFDNTKDGRSMIQAFDKENDSLYSYSDNMDESQKRYIDSLQYAQRQALGKEAYTNSNNRPTTYYNPNNNHLLTPQKYNQIQEQEQEDLDYQRSKEIMRMLNETQNPPAADVVIQEKPQQEYDPVKGLRQQMLFLDSLEKSKDPEVQREMAAKERMKANKDKREAFLNRTLNVSKANNLGNFNHISKEQESNNIKAVIDEDNKGYLGSRIRIRILEDIFIGNKKKKLVKKGTFLYAEISGFSQQRVYLNIVSAMVNNEILPINLTIFDNDGGKGLYVPSSAFREMTRELGASSVQGVNVETGQGFFTSIASNLFRSTSEAVAAIIRKNKVKLKYNSYIYLINEQDLNNSNNEQ